MQKKLKDKPKAHDQEDPPQLWFGFVVKKTSIMNCNVKLTYNRQCSFEDVEGIIFKIASFRGIDGLFSVPSV